MVGKGKYFSFSTYYKYI